MSELGEMSTLVWGRIVRGEWQERALVMEGNGNELWGVDRGGGDVQEGYGSVESSLRENYFVGSCLDGEHL